MRTPTVSDPDLLDALAEVFIRHGVEGASMALLAEAAGIKRGSLYHRFPGGKDEMLQLVNRRLAERRAGILEAVMSDGDPRERAETVARGIHDFYEGGKRACLVPAMTLSSDDDRQLTGLDMTSMAEGLARIARDAGIDGDKAYEIALDAVAFLEGALLVSAAANDTGPFERFISSLPGRLTRLPSPDGVSAP